jgi:hypothetical protein
MLEPAAVPNTYFEVTMDYEIPSARIWLDRAEIVQELFAAFQRWNMSIDDTEVLQTGKPSEQGLKFKIPSKAASFFVGVASCKFSRDNTNWETAEETIDLLDTGLSALIAVTGINIKNRKTLIAMHAQPKTSPFIRFIEPLIAPQVTSMESGDVTTVAIVVKWDNRRVTIDGSGLLANGIFIRIERDFTPDIPYPEIAKQLNADEDQVFAMLGLEAE